MKIKERGFDLILFLIMLSLVCIGMVMIYSSSYVTALERLHRSGFFLQRQILSLAFGSLTFIFFSRLPYWRLKKIALPLFLLSVVFLILVLVPSLAPKANYASRWLDLKIIKFQPSEVLKFTLILFLASLLSEQKNWSFIRGILPYFILLAGIGYLIMKQPDFGTSTLVTLIVFFMLYIANARVPHLVIVGTTFAFMGVIYVYEARYRMARIMSWLDPFQDPQGIGYHVIQSLIAVGSGGLTGLGLAQSRQKFSYLPEQYTDFIFAIISEELGFIGAMTVILLFLALLWRGFLIARQAPDLFGFLLAAGFTFYIVVQAFTNIGVVLRIVPPTGIPLPFISYGGTSLVITMAAMGVLFSISRYGTAR